MVRKKDPVKAQSLAQEGLVLFRQGLFNEAIAKYKESLKADPSYRQASYLKNQAYRARYNQQNIKESE